jgi:regulator of protease activity HflC (stomatin/prohibitin superfamily)
MEANNYLEQVVAEQARVEDELRARRKATPAAPAPAGQEVTLRRRVAVTGGEEGPSIGQAVDYRVTGFWRWKTVVVPPNVYVVHTRRDRAEPLHMGLGLSFAYNPYRDAFLVIPAAVQTLLINARCNSVERQGVLVQAYVQWVVDDLRTAYRKLDFSDPSDPMRIVNVQLREQAEAAIKDKVATMPIDEILSDKQPIIEELTHRLRIVAEGTREGASTTGLGLKIVTVQIKEAVVCSTRLWENLQKPFRAEREKVARVAELEAQQAIARLELENRQAQETAELETARRLDELRAAAQREAYDREQSERARRHRLEQEAEQLAVAERAATEKARRQADEELAVQQHLLEAQRIAREQQAIARQLDLERAQAELERLRTTTTIERDDLEHQARCSREERDVQLFGRRRAVENELSEAHVKAQLVARLPEIAAAMPQPEQLRAITVGGEGTATLGGLLAGLLGLVDGLAHRAGGNGAAS